MITVQGVPMRIDFNKEIYRLYTSKGHSKLTSLIMAQSGISIDDANSFMDVDTGKYKLPNIDMLTDCKKAANIIYDVIINGTGKILVNSDYDADGVSGGGIIDIFLLHYFNVDKNRIVILQNEREFGNGFNNNTLQGVISLYDEDSNIDLLITADHGSKDEERYRLIPKSIKIVVTDHHTTAKKTMPSPVAFVNPQREDSTYDKRISGAVVAYLVMLETAKVFVGKGNTISRNDNFDLPLIHAGITVLSDQMDLRSPLNRYLLKRTLSLLSNPEKGSKWDIFRNVINVPDIVDTKTIGFTIAPMLNGAGRMGSAITSREFVNELDPEKLQTSIRKMYDLNVARKAKQNELMKYSLSQVKTYKKNFNNSLVIKLPEGGGISGIIGGALGEMENRPTFVFTPADNKLVGSGRAIVPNISLPDSFEYISKVDEMVILYGGGHKAAAGLSIRTDKFMDFCRLFDKYVSEQDTTSGVTDTMPYNLGLKVSDISTDIYNDITTIGPFGRGLEAPVFKDTVTVTKLIPVGPIKNHAIMNVLEAKIDMFYPNANIKGINRGDKVVIYYNIEINRGKPSILVKRLVKK